jgi:hypothetical protein
MVSLYDSCQVAESYANGIYAQNHITDMCNYELVTYVSLRVQMEAFKGKWVHRFFPDILVYEGVSKSFRTGRLEWELQMVQLSATRRRGIAILWVSLVSFAAVTLCVASQWVFIVVVYFVMTQSGNFWILPRILPLAVTVRLYNLIGYEILTSWHNKANCNTIEMRLRWFLVDNKNEQNLLGCNPLVKAALTHFCLSKLLRQFPVALTEVAAGTKPNTPACIRKPCLCTLSLQSDSVSLRFAWCRSFLNCLYMRDLRFSRLPPSSWQ